MRTLFLAKADELCGWTGVDLGECAIELVLHDVLSAPQAQTVARFLQRPDVQPVALHLNLCVRTDAATVAELLASVDRHAPTLLRAQVLVEGAANGLLPKPMRVALAGSKVCLRDPHVRSRIFLDLSKALEEAPDAVRQFLSVDTAGPVDDAIEPQVAARLADLALRWGEDAVLRAVSVLSPHQVPLRLDRLPDEALCRRLERLGMPFGLRLSLSVAQATALGEWLGSARPVLKAMVLTLAESLNVAVWMPIVSGLTAQASIQRVELQIANGVALEWPDQNASPVRSVARLDTLVFSLSSSDANLARTVAELSERLQANYLRLQVEGFGAASPLLDALRTRQRARALHGLHIDKSGVHDPALQPSLLEFLQNADRVLFVTLCTRQRLSNAQGLARLEKAARRNWLLRGFELLQREPFQGLQSYHRFQNDAQWMCLRRGPFAFAYGVGSLKGFFQWHACRNADPGQRLAEMRLLEESELRALACVSTHTQRMAIESRCELQAEAIVAAMGDPWLKLDPPSLRALLTGPSGSLDTDLVAAVLRRLRQSCESPALWFLFARATAAHTAGRPA